MSHENCTMNGNPANRISVFYDGACPKCLRDRRYYERLSGKEGCSVVWVDITGKDEELCKLGIEPHRALMELHIMDQHRNIISEIDAYILLMKRIPALKPLAWFIGLPVVRPICQRIYHWQVNRRLRSDGRLQ